jgi:hypothetical protein
MTSQFVAAHWDNPRSCIQQGADYFHVLTHNGGEKGCETCFHTMIYIDLHRRPLGSAVSPLRIALMRCMK